MFHMTEGPEVQWKQLWQIIFRLFLDVYFIDLMKMKSHLSHVNREIEMTDYTYELFILCNFCHSFFFFYISDNNSQQNDKECTTWKTVAKILPSWFHIELISCCLQGEYMSVAVLLKRNNNEKKFIKRHTLSYILVSHSKWKDTSV